MSLYFYLISSKNRADSLDRCCKSSTTNSGVVSSSFSRLVFASLASKLPFDCSDSVSSSVWQALKFAIKEESMYVLVGFSLFSRILQFHNATNFVVIGPGVNQCLQTVVARSRMEEQMYLKH